MRLVSVAWGLLATGGLACGSDRETSPQPVVPSTVTVSISPRALVISANTAYSFVVAVSPSGNVGTLVCTVEPSAVGEASVAPNGGCRVVTGTQVIPGKLIATVGAKSDTASLLSYAGSGAR